MSELEEIQNEQNEQKEFECPISGRIFHDPVLVKDGKHYERKKIQKWFRIKKTSPLTGLEIETELTEDPEFKKKLEEYIKSCQEKSIPCDVYTETEDDDPIPEVVITMPDETQVRNPREMKFFSFFSIFGVLVSIVSFYLCSFDLQCNNYLDYLRLNISDYLFGQAVIDIFLLSSMYFNIIYSNKQVISCLLFLSVIANIIWTSLGFFVLYWGNFECFDQPITKYALFVLYSNCCCIYGYPLWKGIFII